MKLIVLFAIVAVAVASPVYQIAEIDGKAPADTVHAKHVAVAPVVTNVVHTAPVVQTYSAPVVSAYSHPVVSAYSHPVSAYSHPVVVAAPTVVQENPPLVKSQYVAAPVQVKTVKVEAPVVRSVVAAPYVHSPVVYSAGVVNPVVSTFYASISMETSKISTLIIIR
jgi:hypothetical protein